MDAYYRDDAVTLYHGDCREVLPGIDPVAVALLLTDPPYGMDYKPLRGADGSKRWTEGVVGDEEPFSPEHLLRFQRLVLWGANWYADKLPASGGVDRVGQNTEGRQRGLLRVSRRTGVDQPVFFGAEVLASMGRRGAKP